MVSSSSKKHVKKKLPTASTKKKLAARKQISPNKKPAKAPAQAPAKKQGSKNAGTQQKPVVNPIIRPLVRPIDSGLREIPDLPSGQREGTGYRMAADRIDGETVIGDLIVVFPRTREALLRHGLKLDVDEAGDIYMTLDAFAAIHGLKTSALVEEMVEVSRQPPPAPLQSPQQMRTAQPQLASPPHAS